VSVEQFLARLKTAAGALSGRQLVTLTAAFLAVVSLTIGSAYWLNTPTYGVLFSDLDNESASAVVNKLKTDKVQYVLDDGGKTVRVPTNRVDELRLQLASDGMPGSGHIGFELFDRTSFGVTDFLEHVNYRRALEGELARTISTISEVSGARVHIAMPQPSLFMGRDQPTKASVILKLRSNRQLSASTVGAITGLVSASVESLKPESVVIIDNYGRPLSKPETPDQANDGVPLERQQRIESELSARVIHLLEPIVGPGRVRVNVSATLKSNTEEETEERFDPTPVIRSQQSVTQIASGGLAAVQGASLAAAPGVAGARANLPPEKKKADEADAEPEADATTETNPSKTGAAHTSQTTNYEVSKVVRHNVQPRGDIAKLSVAVLLDNEHPAAQPAAEGADAAAAPPAATARPAEDIQKIHGLVAAAVGIDPDRGDQLTVENIAFEEPPVEEVQTPGAWQRFSPQVFEALRILGIVALGAFALFGVIRPMVKTSLNALPAAPKRAIAAGAGGAPRTVQDLEAEMDAQLANGDALRMPAMTRRMASLTQKEPENAARLLRTWLSEDR